MLIVMLGPPGSGKGTIAERLQKEKGFLHISTGNLFREEIKQQTPLGKEAKSYMDKGLLVPDEITIKMLKSKMGNAKKVVLDGFPRTVQQAEALNSFKIDKVLLLEIPEKAVIQRFEGRRVCTAQNHGFHIKYLPPKKAEICDYDQSPLIQRDDDKPATVKKRFREYKEKTEPLEKFYARKKMIIRINGNQTPEKVFDDVLKVLPEL